MTRRISLLTILFCICATGVLAQNIDIPGDAASGRFGATVTTLPNGNFVVTDPLWDWVVPDVGAVYLYDGATGAMISMMIGGRPGDNIGDGGIVVLTDGDFLVHSLKWKNGAAASAGALTRCSMTKGCPESVGADSLLGGHANDSFGSYVVILANGNYLYVSPYWDGPSGVDAGMVVLCKKTTGCQRGTMSQSFGLIGWLPNDRVGSGGVYPLSNGNFVVSSPQWNRGGLAWAGAVTFVNGNTGIFELVSDSNSLVGSGSADQVGLGGIVPLPNGNYVISSPDYDNNVFGDAGAVTFASGTTRITGTINSTNSLVGTRSADQVGREVKVLSNGNYVVASPMWDNGTTQDVGAVTWGSGTTGITGAVTSANSITGEFAADQVGSQGVTPLPNGFYVTASSFWTGGTGTGAGAVTWADGSGPISMVVSGANSLTGLAGDRVGSNGVFKLANGNYVVCSPLWNNGAQTRAGAATWASGSGATSAVVSAANSLTGTATGDRVCGNGVVGLTNGNYAVVSPEWNNGGTTDAGAVTWGDGNTGSAGQVSVANSLTGTAASDQVGGTAVTALKNGNYVVSSKNWNNGAITDAGAVTWCSGNSPTSGPVSAANSLMGSALENHAGSGGVLPLANGNYLVGSPEWDNGNGKDAGAVTWRNGTTGAGDVISAANSLVGSSENDHVGRISEGVFETSDGNYVVLSREWNRGATENAGSVTRGNGTAGTKGAISTANSVTCLATGCGTYMQFTFDAINNQIVVGRGLDNIVTLYRMAATGSVSGQVTDANGTPIRNAIVTLTAPGGQRITAQTGSLGFYGFDSVPTGKLYDVSISAKRYRFNATQPLFVDGNIVDINFAARPTEP